MVPCNIIIKGSSISFGCNLSQPLIDAYSYTLTAAQEYARSINPNPWASDYFDAMIENMSSLGWSNSILGNYAYTPDTNEDIPINIIAKGLLSYFNQSFLPLSASAFDTSIYMKKLIHVLKNAPDSLQLILDMWWGKLKVEANLRKMEIAPLFSVSNNPGTLMSQFSLTLEADSWKSLLNVQDTSSMHFSGKAFIMMLDMSKYAQEEELLKEKLVNEFKNDVVIEKIYL